jgi:hypothetical protein
MRVLEARIASVVAAALGRTPASAQEPTLAPGVTPAFVNPVRPDEPIRLGVDRPLSPEAGRRSVLIGHTTTARSSSDAPVPGALVAVSLGSRAS